MGTKILLADDSITIQKVVGIIFASEEYELAIVDNGDAALAKARETKPDVLLVDAVMPGKTGYEVCEAVRQDPALKGIPILLLTGAFEPFDEAKARQCGADDFISKPFESQHLIDKVTTLVDLGSQRKFVSPQPDIAPSLQVSPPFAEKPVPPPAPQPVTAGAPLAQAAVSAAPAAEPQFAVEMVEGSTDDDLWGAFELEEVAGGDEAGFGEVSLEAPASFTPETAEEPFSFAGEPITTPQTAGEAPQWEAVTEDTFAFEEEVAVGGAEELPAEQFGFEVEAVAPGGTPEETFDIFEEKAGAAGLTTAPVEFDVFAEDVPPAAAVPPTEAEEFFVEEAEPPVVAPPLAMTPPSAAQEPDLQFAPEEEYVPVAAALSGSAAPPAAGGELSEEQLASLISRVSRDIIEKIAWEVVPDLAERIIHEEIRRIKEGR